eukprot:4929162-Prymnesium_polylepis.1
MSRELRAESGLKVPTAGCTAKMLTKLDELAASEAWSVSGEPCAHMSHTSAERMPSSDFRFTRRTVWSGKKLKRGELAGNRFEIVVSGLAQPTAEAASRAERIAAALRQKGWPNYYGPQRFGKAGISAIRGRDLLLAKSGGGSSGRKRKRHSRWVEQLELSAFQSALFNLVVAERIKRGLFDQIALVRLCPRCARARAPRRSP